MAFRFVRNAGAAVHGFWSFLVFVLILLGISLAGCNDTCISFTSNPPNGTINIKAGDSEPTCTLTVAKAALRVVTRTVSTCNSCAPSNRIRQIVVNLRGVGLHPSAIAESASPDWQELLPANSPHALQLDLADGPSSLAARRTAAEAVTIPAATYHQLRLRFSPNVSASGEVSPEKNVCGDVGANCVVLGDGRILPILLDGAEPELHVRSDSGFLFPPDSSSDLVIEFGVSWLLSASGDQGSRFLPELTASVSTERLPGSLAAE